MAIGHSRRAIRETRRRWRPCVELLEGRRVPAGLEPPLFVLSANVPSEAVIEHAAEMVIPADDGAADVMSKAPDPTQQQAAELPAPPEAEAILFNLTPLEEPVASTDNSWWWHASPAVDLEHPDFSPVEHAVDALVGGPGAGYYQGPNGEVFEIIITLRSSPAETSASSTEEPPLLNGSEVETPERGPQQTGPETPVPPIEEREPEGLPRIEVPPKDNEAAPLPQPVAALEHRSPLALAPLLVVSHQLGRLDRLKPTVRRSAISCCPR